MKSSIYVAKVRANSDPFNMKIVSKYWVLGTESGHYKNALSEIDNAIEKTRIVIQPTKKANGVKPIKVGVIEQLKKSGWSDEHPIELFF